MTRYTVLLVQWLEKGLFVNPRILIWTRSNGLTVQFRDFALFVVGLTCFLRGTRVKLSLIEQVNRSVFTTSGFCLHNFQSDCILFKLIVLSIPNICVHVFIRNTRMCAVIVKTYFSCGMCHFRHLIYVVLCLTFPLVFDVSLLSVCSVKLIFTPI